MQKTVGYKGQCKSCQWVFGENPTSAKIDGMPAVCSKCGADMAVVPVYKLDGRGRTYEIRISCKETGATVLDGAILTEEDMMSTDRTALETKMIERLTSSFANIVSETTKTLQLLAMDGGK